MPLFSVIVPVFNRADRLPACLDSVEAQSFRDYELIVVDDGSNDQSAEVARVHSAKPKVLQQTNRGPGEARNLGAHQATGEYLCFLDSDDAWFPGALNSIARMIQDCGGPALMGLAVQQYRSFEEPKAAPTQPDRWKQYQDYLSSSEDPRFDGAGASVVRRNDFLEVGGFASDIRSAEDHDLFLRLGTREGFVRQYAPPVLAYHRHEGGITQNLEAALLGVQFLVAGERKGRYPGGKVRRLQRWAFICRHARSLAFACLQIGKKHASWNLYRSTLDWQIALGRWRFLIGFPFYALSARKLVLRPDP